MTSIVNGIEIPEENNGQYIEDIEFDDDGNQIIVKTGGGNYNKQIEGDMTTAKIKSLYTDSACSGNPGPSGWGAVVCFADGNCHKLGGGDPKPPKTAWKCKLLSLPSNFLLIPVKPNQSPFTLTAYTLKAASPNGFKAGKTKAGKPARAKMSLTKTSGTC